MTAGVRVGLYFPKNDPSFSFGVNVCVAVVDSEDFKMASQLRSTGKFSVALCQKTLFTAAILARSSRVNTSVHNDAN